MVDGVEKLSLSTNSSSAIAPSTSPLTDYVSIAALISSLPIKLQELNHQIQIASVATSLTSDGTLNLTSALGIIILKLTPSNADSKQTTEQLITGLMNTERALTLIIQPGNPPEQATLVLPTTNASSSFNTPSSSSLTSPLMTEKPALPLRVGDILTAIILPPAPSSPIATSLLNSMAGLDALKTPLESNEELSLLALKGAASTDISTLRSFSTVISSQTIPQEYSLQEASVLQVQTPNVLGDMSLKNDIPLDPARNMPLSPFLDFPSEPSALSESMALESPIHSASSTTSFLANPSMAGAQLVIKVNDILVPGASPTSLAPNTRQIVATISNVTPAGATILTANNLTLYIKQPVNVSVGSTLLLTLETDKASPSTLLPSRETNNFTVLSEILSALSQIDTQLASQVMATRIPVANNTLASTLLYMMGAYNKPNGLKQWLGDEAVNTLNNSGKSFLIDKLEKALANAVQEVRDTTVGEWKSYSFPIQTNNMFQSFNLYVHQDPQHPFHKPIHNQSGSGYMRFLIDMNMSKLGAVQVDGFIQPKKLDMIVRSEEMLPLGLHQDLRDTYIKMLGGINYIGSLNFQIGRQHWVNIVPPLHKTAVTTS